MKLRDTFASDVGTFMDTDEFATPHQWNDRQISLIMDHNMLKEHPMSYAHTSHTFGVSLSKKVVYADPIELGYKPEDGEEVRLDGKYYIVVSAEDEDGLLAITLDANTS
ncbi:hypothetical protein [Paenibacillus sp. 481]|uniref:hypothetical protein n=1 Tax=Paenibacillus sp. 481 TaxID=2835869 RepID=UPI001E39931F|nr:hypothetical protein [Paenibacillus sp. 481]UHA74467.1 hypothetical protein KIK04_04995 [Paenibacillus sp. 481]